jgi:hypothetical protein
VLKMRPRHGHAFHIEIESIAIPGLRIETWGTPSCWLNSNPETWATRPGPPAREKITFAEWDERQVGSICQLQGHTCHRSHRPIEPARGFLVYARGQVGSRNLDRLVVRRLFPICFSRTSRRRLTRIRQKGLRRSIPPILL